MMLGVDAPGTPVLADVKEQDGIASGTASTASRSSNASGSSNVRAAVHNGHGDADADASESLHSECLDEDYRLLQPRKDLETQPFLVSRSEEYRQLFHLPPEEVLVEDFNCAVQKKILLQGHMYLFLHYVCFYSNIFGYEKKKIIPLRDITCVQKARTAGLFPNAIEIVAWGKKHFFASFLSRDEAYRLIVDGWSRHSEHAQLFLGSQDSSSSTTSSDRTFVSLEGHQSTQSIEYPHIDSVSRDIEKAPIKIEDSNNQAADQDGACRLIDEQEILDSSVRNIFEEESTLKRANSTHVTTSTWQVEDEDAPKLPDHYRMVLQSNFPIDVEEFFHLFFSNDATGFAAEFHRKCGDEDFQCTEWHKHRHIGHVRDVSFRHPIKFYFGSKFTLCQEVQRFQVYRNSHLVLETSQQMNDIPYGDYFRVEGLWNVERVPVGEINHCVLRIFVNVSFSKKTVWKGKIEQGTSEECKEAYSIWVQDAHALLKIMGKHRVKTIDETPSLRSVPDNKLPQRFEVDGHENGSTVQLKEVQNSAISKTSSRSQDSSYRPCLARTPEKEPLPESDVKLENMKWQSNAETCLTKSTKSASESSPLLPQLYSSLSLHLKPWSQLSLILALIFAAILVITQMGIIMLLARHPKVQYVPPASYTNVEDTGHNLRGSNSIETEAWLEQRVYYLKEEMSLVEARLKSIHHEFALLKMHLQALDRFTSKLPPNSQHSSYSP